MDDTDAVVEQILTSYDSITVVGASQTPSRPAHYVPEHMAEHGWRIVPVNPVYAGGTILGEKVYPSLAEVPGPVGLVNVFRRSEFTPEVAREAVAAGATALWLQLHIRSDEARRIATEAGLLYVQDRCLIIEQRRLGLSAPAVSG